VVRDPRLGTFILYYSENICMSSDDQTLSSTTEDVSESSLEDDEGDYEVEDYVKHHPMESFRQFSDLSVGDSYGMIFAKLINELATQVPVEVNSEQELLDFSEMVGRPALGIVSFSGSKGMGTMHWADPNEGVVNSIASTARFKEIENRIDNTEEQISDLPDSEEISKLIEEATSYEYDESKHVEQAKEMWNLVNVEDFMFRADDSIVVDGGYFRDNVMGYEPAAESFASSEIGMAAVFASDQMVL